MTNIDTTNIVETEVAEKPYTFRRLDAPDIFIMVKIISKIGINEFTDCFEKDSVKNLIQKFVQDKEEGVDVDDEQSATIMGVSVVLEVANVVFAHLPDCEHEIYQILSQTSNLSIKEVKALDMVTFLEMIVDFIKKEEFGDFIKVVSKFVK